jgi:hypothetical protein
MLVEPSNPDWIRAYRADNGYEFVESLTDHDYLFRVDTKASCALRRSHRTSWAVTLRLRLFVDGCSAGFRALTRGPCGKLLGIAR